MWSAGGDHDASPWAPESGRCGVSLSRWSGHVGGLTDATWIISFALKARGHGGGPKFEDIHNPRALH